MKKATVRSWIMIALLATSFNSCNQKSEVCPESAKEQTDGMVKLVRKLENPYSVANMQKAYANLSNSGARAALSELVVTTSHRYIKFKPKNEDELATLKQDSSLVLYTYPMDYEISQGSAYHDPKVPIGQPTYQYCSVPVNKSLPRGIEYEVLENLYIPDENKDGDEKYRMASDESVTTLVDEALRITGNLSASNSNVRTAASSWRPAGRIRVWDDSKGVWKGVEGVIVKARRWFTTHTGTVDGNGNYSCDGTFKRDANYSLDWERYEFSLRDGSLNGANINGPKKEGNWDNDFNGGINAFYAKVFIGAFRYYYKNIDGLKRPPLNSFLKTQMHIRCMDEEGRSFFNKNNRFLGLGSPIKIYSKERTTTGVLSTANAERLFNVVIHELAHASHWELRKNNWTNGTDDRLQESWAMGVAWYLTRKDYPSHNNYANMTFADMKDPNFGDYEYTPIIIDLLDNINQGGCCSTTLPIDEISGYTIKNIEDVLKDCKSLADLRDKLKSNYIIPNQAKLDKFFDQYINL